MMRCLLLVAAVAFGTLTGMIAPAEASAGVKAVHVAPARSGVARGPHMYPPAHRPVFVPQGALFSPFYGQTRRTIVVNNVVVIRPPRAGLLTVTELPEVMGIRRTPTADPVIHRVDRHGNSTLFRGE